MSNYQVVVGKLTIVREHQASALAALNAWNANAEHTRQAPAGGWDNLVDALNATLCGGQGLGFDDVETFTFDALVNSDDDEEDICSAIAPFVRHRDALTFESTEYDHRERYRFYEGELYVCPQSTRYIGDPVEDPNGFRVEIVGGDPNDDTSVHLWSGGEELVMWHRDEWAADEHLLPNIVTAVKIGYENGPGAIHAIRSAGKPAS